MNLNWIRELALSGDLKTEFWVLQCGVVVLTLVALILWSKTLTYEKRLVRYGSQTKLMEGLGYSLEDQMMARMAQLGFKLSMYQRFEKRYWIESGLRKLFSPLPFVVLPFICLVNGLLFCLGTYRLFLIEGVAFSGFWLGVLTPLQLVEWHKYHQNKLIINELPTFFGILTRWAQINPDVFFCLNKLEKGGLRHKLVGPFTRFTRACDNGISTSVAFKQLDGNFHLRLLSHFSKCLQEVIQNRGDLVKLLEAFEEEAYQIQLEESKRNAVQMKYKLLINALCVIAFMLIYFLLKTNQVLSGFYIETDFGQMLLSGLSLLVVFTFMVSLNTSRVQV